MTKSVKLTKTSPFGNISIICWNVNGIRAAERKGSFDWLIRHNADIICIQETKAHPDQLSEGVRNPSGYFSYFNTPKEKKGYSGVAIFSKEKPQKVEYDMGHPDLDSEGRLIAAFYEKYVVITGYFPNGGGGQDRLDYKLKFYAEFSAYLERIRKTYKHIIFCGDINTAHTEIDLARPKDNVKNTGFLPIERAWIDDVVSLGYVDVFRALNPETKDVYTYWDMKTFSRERNVGWRIDYFFITKNSLPFVKKFTTHTDIFGSDHCPISISLE